MKNDDTKTNERWKKKARDFEVMATVCGVNPDDMLEDMAISVEKTNHEVTKSRRLQDKTKDPYLVWWSIFLEEWSRKCVTRWLGNKDLKDEEWMQNMWYGFEILWEIGCDMVRITRLNELREGISKVIARESPSKSDTEKIWKWHDESMKKLDEAVSKMVVSFKEVQRQAATQLFSELKKYDEASLLGKLRQLTSLYLAPKN